MNMLIPISDVQRWFALGDHDPAKATRIAIAELRKRADGGDQDAAMVLDGWLHGGARQDLKSAFRAQDQVLIVGPDLPLARRFSVKQDDGSRQLVAWEVMTHDQFKDVLREYRAQSKRRSRILRIFDRVAKVWDANPELATAADAFRAAGIEPAPVADVA